MQNSEKLKNLLENEIIPDLESAIDELFEIIEKSKKASSEQKNDFEELREMRTECFSIIDELSEDEIVEILEELMELKSNQE